jgi:hypothetical protein
MGVAQMYLGRGFAFECGKNKFDAPKCVGISKYAFGDGNINVCAENRLQ